MSSPFRHVKILFYIVRTDQSFMAAVSTVTNDSGVRILSHQEPVRVKERVI